MKVHIASVRTYIWVFFGLLALTLATTEIARIDLGPFNSLAAMLIAASKTMLVVLFFMHMKWSTYRTQIVAAAGLFWLAIMIVFVLSDYLTRGLLYAPRPW